MLKCFLGSFKKMDSKIYLANEFYNFYKILFQAFETFQNVFHLLISKTISEAAFLDLKV